MSSFEQAWRAFYGDRETSEPKVRAARAYEAAVRDGRTLSGFVTFVRDLDKTGRDFRGALQSYLFNLEPATAAQKPVPKPVAATVPRAPSPSVPTTNPAPPPRDGDPFAEAWVNWPRNKWTEQEGPAREAFDVA